MTWIVIIITCLISVYSFNDINLFLKLKFSPYLISKDREWYRFLTSGFVHADWMHLFVNMFVLYSFGSELERYMSFVFGIKYKFLYLIMYFTSIILPLYPSYRKNLKNPGYSSIGASGAVSAVVFACIIYNPLASFMIIFIPIRFPAFVFGILYLIYSAYMSRKKIDNIGHDVHFWGSIYGVLFTIALKPKLFIYALNQILSVF
ncbi:MAG: rhomboid family intramembrane serine protease [Bacteroidota bacterium]|nr:rhomboid family intramembrane serine protease [Bacteroidota bacterium]